MIHTETLIIGGGLAGLAVAAAMHADGRDVLLLEARERLGGRILSLPQEAGKGAAAFDLGPAWFWPGQTRMEALVARLGLVAFEQFSTGDLVYEDETGRVHRGRGHASMVGSWRIAGGMAQLIAGVSASLPQAAVKTSHRVTRLMRADDGLRATCDADGVETIIATRRIVLAVPPRLAAANIDMSEVVSTSARRAMSAIPTWMAGHAKIVAVYERPFWREAGLSGDAMSRRGPLVEIHDASPDAAGPYALFGFVGVPAQRRTDADALRAASIQQLGRMFGPDAARPIEVFAKDWAYDANTATADDLAPLTHHPAYGLPSALDTLGHGRLHLASTETAATFGGYLEGALEAAESCVLQLRHSLQT